MRTFKKTKKTTMKTIKSASLILTAIILISSNSLFAHNGNEDDHPDVNLHVNSDLTICGFQFHSDLTQEEYKRFTKEVGHIIYFKPMTSAKPLGKMKFSIALQNDMTSIDQTSGAWNNTFHHPDSTHWLGDQISLPAIYAQIGITDNIDFGIWYSNSAILGGDYSFIAYHLKYAFYNDTETGWAAATRISFAHDVNIKDVNISNFGVDVLVSKTFGGFTPYAGIAGTRSHTKEFSDQVDLHDETIINGRVLIGAEYRWKFINLGVEADFSHMTTFAYKIGVMF